MMQQLEFFPVDENMLLRKEILRVEESCHKVRRCMFKNYSDISKKVHIEHEERIYQLELKIAMLEKFIKDNLNDVRMDSDKKETKSKSALHC